MKKNKLSPWEIMRPTLIKLGYTNEHIDEMTLQELFELAKKEK